MDPAASVGVTQNVFFMTKRFYNVTPALVPPLHHEIMCPHTFGHSVSPHAHHEILFLITINEKQRAEDMKGTRVWCLLTVQ